MTKAEKERKRKESAETRKSGRRQARREDLDVCEEANERRAGWQELAR